MKKTKFFLCIEKEEKWLNEMNQKGYRLIGKSGFTYHFEPVQENRKYRYFIDQRSFMKDNEEFAGFLEELQIRLITKQFGLYYFEADESCNMEHIYTDSDSRMHFYARCIAGLLFLAVLNISILNRANGPYLLNVSIPVVVNTVILCLVVITIIKYIMNIFSLIQNNR